MTGAMMAARAIQIGEAGGLVAGQITAQRQQRRWDQAQLAARVTEAGRTMSASVLGKIESGHRRVDVDDLVAIAAALDVPVAALLGSAADRAERVPQYGAVETAVREDIEQLGELVGIELSLSQMAYALAGEVDAGGEGGRQLPSLNRELRQTLAQLVEGRATDDDDDLGDLGSTE
ncbi:helix-turn-helix domain-containing protein [Streptomyces sp. NPDC058394]|uniref:helix-turn-helix domain-containing protein n=1 Tax=Streptomyces sp. NPDC058394 TaxID=3346477 RepID=UPI00365841C2